MGEITATLYEYCEAWPLARSTEDLDIFLRTEILANSEQVISFRESLESLGYKVLEQSKYFQFTDGAVVIDLLTGPIEPRLRNRIKVRNFRAGSTVANLQLHAHITEEALSLEHALTEIRIDGILSTGERHTAAILIPNSFTFLLMKLHAFFDQVDKQDKQFGKHHASDIYRIVAMMTEQDFNLTNELIETHKNAPACQHASVIAETCFKKSDAIGILRLKAHESYSDNMKVDEFREILLTLFAPVRKSQEPSNHLS